MRTVGPLVRTVIGLSLGSASTTSLVVVGVLLPLAIVQGACALGEDKLMLALAASQHDWRSRQGLRLSLDWGQG